MLRKVWGSFAAGQAGIADDPALRVRVVGLGASTLDFAIRAWVRAFDDP